MKTHTHTHHMIHILIGKRDEYIDISKIEWEIKIVIDTKYLKKTGNLNERLKNAKLKVHYQHNIIIQRFR